VHVRVDEDSLVGPLPLVDRAVCSRIGVAVKHLQGWCVRALHMQPRMESGLHENKSNKLSEVMDVFNQEE